MNDTPTSAAALREEIIETRAALGETVEALAARADIKERLHGATEDAKRAVRERVDQSRTRVTTMVVARWPMIVGTSAGLVAVLLGIRLWRRR